MILTTLLFIGSYVGALHSLFPHQLPIAVKNPAELGARLDAPPPLSLRK